MTTMETGTALAHRSARQASRSTRPRRLADPGFGRRLRAATWTEGEWRRAARGLQPDHIRRRPPLRPGIPGTQGLPADGTIRTFRPAQNAARFANSARRLAMAELPDELFIGSIEALVRQDRDWVPSGQEKSLYLRPFMISTEIGLGVRPANSYEYLLIASPAGAYFPRGLKPVSVWVSDDYVRAAPGGTGEAKCAGNYAASLATGRGIPPRVRPGGLARRRGAPGSRRWADEPVLRPRPG